MVGEIRGEGEVKVGEVVVKREMEGRDGERGKI